VESLFRKESDLRDFIKEKLEEQGHEVSSEVTVYSGYRVDLLVAWKNEEMNWKSSEKRKGKKEAIEVKVDRYDIPDGISYANELKRIPVIQFSSVAAPEIFCGEDEKKFASMLDIGLIGVTKQDIKYLIEPKEITKIYLQKSVSIPNLAFPGKEFKIEYSFVPRNKIAANLQVEYTPSGPLRRLQGGVNRGTIPELLPGEREEITLTVKVREDAKPGSYPLMIKTTCEGMTTDYELLHIQVKQRKQPST